MLRKTDIMKRRWIILAATCIINLCIGSIYAWSVFANPMCQYLSDVTGTEITSLAIVFTVANSIAPITMITGGQIVNKIGPKYLIMIGGGMYGVGLILAGFSKSAGMLLFSYGIIAGFGLGLVYGCTISNAVKFFPDKKGFAGGITTAFYGLSSVILPPIANSLIEKNTVTGAFRILGIAMLAIIIFCSLFIEKCPFEAQTETGSSSDISVTQDKNWKEMLRTSYFYIMVMMLCCGAFAGLMVTSQASPMAQLMLNMEPSFAAVIVSVLALFNAGGRLISGTLSDKLGPQKTMRIVFILLFIGAILLFLPLRNRTVTFYAGIMITGICFGSIMGIFPGFTTIEFGPRNNGTNYGIMFCGFAIAGLAGPMIASTVLSATDSYQVSFIFSAALALIGLGLTFVKRRSGNERIQYRGNSLIDGHIKGDGPLL